MSGAISIQFVLYRRVNRSVQRVNLVVFRRFVTSCPVFHALVNRSSAFSNGIFGAIRINESGLLLPFRNHGSYFYREVIQDELNDGRCVFVVLLLPLHPRPTCCHEVSFYRNPNLIRCRRVRVTRLLWDKDIPSGSVVTNDFVGTHHRDC